MCSLKDFKISILPPMKLAAWGAGGQRGLIEKFQNSFIHLQRQQVYEPNGKRPARVRVSVPRRTTRCADPTASSTPTSATCCAAIADSVSGHVTFIHCSFVSTEKKFQFPPTCVTRRGAPAAHLSHRSRPSFAYRMKLKLMTRRLGWHTNVGGRNLLLSVVGHGVTWSDGHLGWRDACVASFTTD
jgi:hypothetical protein